jgi:hypothetical protein
MFKLMNMKTKHWYLKNLDMFSHLRNEDMHHIIEKTSSMKEIKRGEGNQTGRNSLFTGCIR